MKCPKCSYLGFETGDRCKNCGYDFSLIESSQPAEVEVDLSLHIASEDPSDTPAWADQVDRALGPESIAPGAPAPGPLQIATPPVVPEPERLLRMPQPVAARAARRHAEPSLPLFARGMEDAEDEPLIKLPAVPRPPLAVRRTPEVPKLRTVPRPPVRVSQEPTLQFADEPSSTGETPASASFTASARDAGADRARAGSDMSGADVSGAGARLAAAAVDHGLLLAIDLGVVYFTLRMAALPLGEWQVLPPAPMLTFLLLLKVSYFCAFTAVGGQTIGKMAARIRVVTDTGAPVDGARAMKRTIAGAISVLTLGLGFIPALVGSERRALHDRLARTRVIAVRSV